MTKPRKRGSGRLATVENFRSPAVPTAGVVPWATRHRRLGARWL